MSPNSINLDVCRTQVIQTLQQSFPDVCPDDLQDVVSEALYIYLSSSVPWSVQESRDRSTAWLRTVARRQLWKIGEERKWNRRYVASQKGEDVFSTSTSTEYCAAEWAANRVLKDLSPLLAETIWQHAIEGEPPRLIAQSLGCSVNAVKLRLKRGYRILRMRLKEME